MDIRKIKKLIEIIEESDIAEIEIREGEESVRISRYSAPPSAPIAVAANATSGVAHTIDFKSPFMILFLSQHKIRGSLYTRWLV